VELSRIDWGAATRALAAELDRAAGPDPRHALAAASSLRARFTHDHAVATAAAATALRLEPLDPLHRVRTILMRLRFGDLAGALADLAALPDGIAERPHLLVLKAFATLRCGEPSTARNIADRAIQTDPRCAPARFLHLEATFQAQRKGGLDKLAELPRGPALEPAWADLLAKLAILRPNDHRAVAAQLDRGVITRGTRADLLVRTVMRWASPATAVDDLARSAAGEPAGSRAEQLALTLLAGRLIAADPATACTTLHAIARRDADRPAVRRTLVAALTQLAVVEAGAERLTSALRIVQACIELEPHEPVHHQNRAVVFTLLGEHASALDAWAELDQLHYRLALLGRLDPASAARYAAPHRMFALAARLSPGGARSGVFAVEPRDDGALALEVNQDAIDRDPEQLRQWLHHSRAALVFELLALGTTRDRLLLAPDSPAQATERAEGVGVLVQSLAVLVPDEGRRLADRLVAQLRAVAAGAVQRYRGAALDADAQIVQRHAIELYAELARICTGWSPDPGRREIVDEVVETLRAVAPLVDGDALSRLADAAAHGPPGALGFVRRIAAVMLAIAPEDRDRPLQVPDRRRLTTKLASWLRVALVRRCGQGAGEAECERLAEELDGVRHGDPDSAFLEYVAARVLATGRLFDEASQAIAAFHRIPHGKQPFLESVESLQDAIAKARGAGDARTRTHQPQAVHAETDARDLTAREAELDDQPTSIRLYIALCHELALAGRWRDAHAWAGRAIARCLTSAGQLRARELALELLGLEELAAADRGAIASYVAGARSSAVAVLERMPVGGVGLEYLRGASLLAADRRAEARAAFAAALALCTRGIYLAVLRPLAADVEHALLETARQELDTACQERRYADACARIVERMATVVAPAPYLLELARVLLAAQLQAIGTANAPDAAPDLSDLCDLCDLRDLRVEAVWRDELVAALAIPGAIARIRALAGLAIRHHEPGIREAQGLVRKLDELEAQLAVVAALEQASARIAAGELEGALAALSGTVDDGNPRIVRQRAIVLLQLARYDAADAAVAELGELADPIAREFVSRYPKLRLRRRITAASALITTGDFTGARAVLEAAAAADVEPDAEHQLELAYARACCAAADGYHRDDRGDRAGALERLFEALGCVESCLELARARSDERLLALRTRLEGDVAALEGFVS
jgi:predicted negative regulator of RcsB-dependent stress response